MLALYYCPGSSSFAAHIALHETGVPFEGRPLKLDGVANRTPAYLALNPQGKVPTLVIDGCALTEVAGILFYLAKRYPEANLLPPGDVETDAQAVSWMSFLASSVHPARRQGLDHARGIFGIAERRLRNGPWALGPAYSIVDIHLFRLFWRFRLSLNPDLAEFPLLAAHHDRMMQRPAVKRTFEIEQAIGYDPVPH
jgi:glutathione S-transferase